MIQNLKAGQSIKCTITAKPRNPDAKSTLERLMRQDPANARGLRKAHKKRQQGMIIYNRGNRDWVKRAICGKLVKAEIGQTWTMTFTHDLTADMQNVSKLMKIENA